MMETIVPILFICILLLLSGFFAGTETALFSLSKIAKRRLEQKHHVASRWVLEHLAHPRQTLITILTGNLLVNILATSMMTILAMHFWDAGGVSLILAAFTVVLIFVGEILPKIIAVRSNESFVMLASFPLKIFSILLSPLCWAALTLTDRMMKLFFPKRREQPSDAISEEELKAMVKIGEEEGVLDSQERYMIQKLFQLGEHPVKTIMTPRVNLKGINLTFPREEHLSVIRQYHFTHFPVYRDSIDNIVGVVLAQEYILHAEKDLAQLMKQPFFIPETKRIDDLLAEFRKQNENFAICVDEYGGTDGIVTLEDVLEEIFGEFYDEYAKIETPIKPLGQDAYLIEAKIPVTDFNEFFKTRLKTEESTTLGGYLLEKLGEVPTRGQKFSEAEFDFEIHEVLRKKLIRRVIVRKKYD